MQFLSQYGLFLAEAITIVLSILFVVSGIVAITGKDKDKPKFKIRKLNQQLEETEHLLQKSLFNKKQCKAITKQHKQEKKQHEKQQKEGKQRHIFVLHFKGDIRASAVEALRHEITAILTVAKTRDEIVICVDSPGGTVNSYGLAASQLQRIKDRGIPLTVCVDKIAASGGYLIACVANKLLAAPFAIIGSVGVVAQLPNFHRLLKKKHIDFELLTAGEYKRTLTVFGENTDKARQKLQTELSEMHEIFKEFISEHRPQVDIQQIATGEHWLAKRAFELRLVDQLITSDDYLLQQHKTADIVAIQLRQKHKMLNKLTHTAQKLLGQYFDV